MKHSGNGESLAAGWDLVNLPFELNTNKHTFHFLNHGWDTVVSRLHRLLPTRLTHYSMENSVAAEDSLTDYELETKQSPPD